ncbi:hypothetical protein D3218_01685 [Aureimonas flava]|uniref:DUF1376 domain-containing protein n=2 Tax=Aureimonas flava TaxID=2320271 RepID=A0A3A1WR26_9HYPH|nr:hypothetical protein D3218_01685 [Aureimonas flava]
MKFFPADWQSDVLLRSCSIAARGLWIELLCIMQKAEPVGHLLVNGKAPAPSLLAVLCGTSEKEIRRLLDELREAGVFDEADGVIVSRRMVRDAEKAERDKTNGKKGGNPAVKAGVNPPVKPSVEGGINPIFQKPEARSQKNTLGASAPIEPAAPDPFEVFWRLYPKRDGSNPKKPAKEKFEKLVKAGADPEQITAAAIRLAAKHPKPTPYVPQALKWLGQERFNDDDTSATIHALVGDEQWSKRLAYARRERQWARIEWGPMPGEHGCRVPTHLLQPDDGQGWTAQKEAA